jgi:hypothetical protein
MRVLELHREGQYETLVNHACILIILLSNSPSPATTLSCATSNHPASSRCTQALGRPTILPTSLRGGISRLVPSISR